MSRVTSRGWIRAVKGKGVICPICGDDQGCMIKANGEAAICIRVEQGCAKRRDGTPIVAKDGMGWLHDLNGKPAKLVPSAKAAKPAVKRTAREWQSLHRKHVKALTPDLLREHAESLGVSADSLVKLGAGYDARTSSLSFPMFDGQGRIIGLRLRSKDGRFKGAVRGSRNGLFIPGNLDALLEDLTWWDDVQRTPLLVLPEGPTSAAAALDMGFAAIGRANNCIGAEMIRDLLEHDKNQKHVVIVADNDKAKYLADGTIYWPGWEGAMRVAMKLVECPRIERLNVVQAPGGVKDLRDWIKAGGNGESIRQLIESAMPHTKQTIQIALDLAKERKEAAKMQAA